MNPHQDPSSSPRDADDASDTPDAPDSSAGSTSDSGANRDTASDGRPGNSPGGTSGGNQDAPGGMSGGNPDARGGSTRIGPSAGAGFFGWVRSLRIVRGQDRWIGGVATGISARTGLDVILVRGLFVVLAIFGGIGLLAYGLAWALLPEPDGRIHAESAGRGSWTSGMTGALVVSLLGLWRPDAPFFGNTGGFGGFIWSLFWIGVAVFIVYWISNSSRNRTDGGSRTPPAGTPPAGAAQMGPFPAGTASAGTASTGTDFTGAASTDAFPPTTAPTYSYADYTGYSDYSDYSGYAGTAAKPAPKPVVPRPTGADVAIFVGGALLCAALVLVLDYVGFLDLGASVIAVALATGVVVLGLGIVLLGIRGRTSGALGFLAMVGILATIISSSSPPTGNWVLADQGRWSMTAASPASEGYTVVVGQGRVDLTGLGDITEDVVIPVTAAAGNVGILVPEDVPVDVRSRMALSSTEVVSADDTTSVSGLWQPRTVRLNEDAEGPRIILDVRGVVSHITVATTEEALRDTESRQER